MSETTEEALVFGISKLYERLKHGTYSLLYVMSKTADEPNWRCTLWFFVIFMQVLSFHFPLPFDYTAKIDKVFGWQYYTDWIAYFSAGFRMIPFFQLSGLAMFSFFLISLSILLIAIVFVILVGTQSTVSNYKTLWSLKFLRNLSEFIFVPFYIPMLSFLFQFVSCSPATSSEINGTLIGCGTSTQASLSAISIALSSIFIIMAMIYSSSFYSKDPTSSSLIARPHSRVQLWQMFLYSVYTVAIVIGEARSATQWLIDLMLFMGNITLAHQYYKKMPYYNWVYNQYCFIGTCIHVWTSLCVGINIAFPANINAVSLMFFAVLPLIVYTSYTALEIRKDMLQNCLPADLKSHYDVELKSRFLCETVTAYLRQRNKEYGRYLNENAVKFDIGYSYQPLPSFPRSAEEHENIRSEHERIICEVEELYFEGVRRYPVTMMALFRAEKDIASALHTLSKAESFHPAFDETFAIFALRMTYSELDETNQRDIVAYMQWQAYQELAKKEDERATDYQLKFWTELANAHPDLDRLHELSSVIHTSINLANDAFKKLVKLNNNSERVLRLFASFLIDVMSRPEEAAGLLRRADELEEAGSRSHYNASASASSGLLDDKLAIVSISGSMEKLGDMVDVNSCFVRLLGFSRSELLSSNITRCMPAPFSIHHDVFLKRYKRTGRSTMMNTNNFLTALHKNGYLVPFEFYIREVSSSSIVDGSGDNSESSSNFIAVIKPAGFVSMCTATIGPMDTNAVATYDTSMKIDLFYVDSSLNVTYCTPGCSSLFGISLEMIQTGFRVNTWISHFDEYIEQLNNSNENQFDAEFKFFPDGLLVPAKLKIQRVTVHLDFIYSCQLVIQPDAISKVRSSKSYFSNPSKKQISNDISVNVLESLDYNVESSGNFAKKSSFTIEHSGVVSSALRDKMEEDIELANRKHENAENAKSEHARSEGGGSSGGSSGASSASAATLHARLNSFSKASQTQGLRAGLRKLMAVLLLSIILICAVAVVKFSVLGSMVSSYNDLIYDCYYSARMRFLAARLALNTRAITYSPKTSFNGFFTHQSCLDFKNIDLVADAIELQYYNDMLVVNRGASLDSTHYDLWIQPIVQMQYQVNSGGSMFIRTDLLSLWNAVKTYLQKIRSITPMNINDIIDTEENVFYVIQNGFGKMFNTLNTSAFLYEENAQTYIDQVYAVALSLSLVGILSIFLVVFVIVKPTVWLVEDNKHSVLMLFTEIPFAVIQSFQLRCNDRLARLRKEKEEHMKEGNELNQLDYDNNAIDRSQEDNTPENKVRVRAAIRTSVKSNQSFEWGKRHTTLLQISSLIAICLIYFVSSYWIEFGAIQSFLVSYPAAINWGQYRMTEFMRSEFIMRSLVTQQYMKNTLGGSSFVTQYISANASESISFLFDIQNSLSFGSTRRDLKAPTGTLFDITFTSASCTSSSLYSPAPLCTNFVPNGIHQALVDCTANMRVALTFIQAANLSNPQSINSTINSVQMVSNRIQQEKYLTDLSSYSSNLVLNEATSVFSNVFASRLVALLIFLIISILMFLFYFYPLVYELNEDQKRTIAFLLFIPASVMEKMQSLRTFVETLAQDSSS